MRESHDKYHVFFLNDFITLEVTFFWHRISHFFKPIFSLWIRTTKKEKLIMKA